MSPQTKQTTTSSGKARLFPVVAALAVLAFGAFAATQHVASALSYQPALGEPAFVLFGTPVYQPLGFLKWFLAFRHVDHPVLDAAFTSAARFMGVALAVAAVVAIFLRHILTRDLQKVTPDLHGTAHWMTAEDVAKSGLIGSGEGVYIGAWQHPKTKVVHYLRHNGPEHVLALAPTRSGKGVGLVLPTLLSWPGSVVVHDMKGEAWAITAGWRQSIGHKTLRFDPADPTGTGVCYNPLEEVRLGTEKEVGDVQNLVTMIVDPDGKGLNDHWAKTGHALLVGAVLHVLYTEPNKTLCGVADFLSDPSRPFEDALNAMLETEHDDSGTKGWITSSGEPTLVHPVVASSARDMLNKADNERSGVLSTAMSFLTLYRDPIVAANTRRSEFKITDLMNHDDPVSLYLVVRPSDKDRLKPLIRLMMNQIVRGLVEHMEFEGGRSVASYKHRLLLLIDEFPALGKLEIFEEALAFIAGYGIKAYLIAQDKAQLEKHYSKDESITSNTHIRIAYAPNKIETAKMLSEMIGTTTVVKTSYSFSGKRSKTTLDSISAQASEVSRPLLTPDEVMRLRGPKKDAKGNITDAGDMLIFQAGEAPILGTQILYFLDPTFAERSKIAPPAQSDRLRSAQTPALPAPSPIPKPAAAAPVTEPAEADAEDDYESPPLTDDALIGDDEPYPDVGQDHQDVLSAIAEEEPPALGRELSLTAEELAELDDPDADDDEQPLEPMEASGSERANDVAGDREGAPADPFLAASLQWAVSSVPPKIPLPEPAPEPIPAADNDAAPADPLDLLPPEDEGTDPYVALSRRWADRPPAPNAMPQSPPAAASVAANDSDDADPMADFALLNEMAARPHEEAS